MLKEENESQGQRNGEKSRGVSLEEEEEVGR